MWIHLLSLGLIDGAGGNPVPPDPPYVPPAQAGSGGGGKSTRELFALFDRVLKPLPKRVRKVVLDEIPRTADPQAVARIIAAATVADLPSTPSSPELRSLRARLAAIRRDLEDEECAVVTLLLC